MTGPQSPTPTCFAQYLKVSMSPAKLVKANCNVMCHPGTVEVHIELTLCVHCACMLAVCSKREKNEQRIYGRAKDATDCNVLRLIHIACWIKMATCTDTQNMWHVLPFHGNNCYANAPQFYVCIYSVCLVIQWQVAYRLASDKSDWCNNQQSGQFCVLWVSSPFKEHIMQ